MDRYRGTCEPLGPVEITGLADWIGGIPLLDWPQRERMAADQPYPAMVSNLDWHDFGAMTDGLVADLLARVGGGAPSLWDDHRMLSVVMPGQQVARHDDQQSETWRVRIHVPLLSDEHAVMGFTDPPRPFQSDRPQQEVMKHLKPGTAYLVNTEVEHWLANWSDKPRVHLFFDVREGR